MSADVVTSRRTLDHNFFFFLIDKQPNIIEKARKPHVYKGVY